MAPPTTSSPKTAMRTTVPSIGETRLATAARIAAIMKLPKRKRKDVKVRQLIARRKRPVARAAFADCLRKSSPLRLCAGGGATSFLLPEGIDCSGAKPILGVRSEDRWPGSCRCWHWLRRRLDCSDLRGARCVAPNLGNGRRHGAKELVGHILLLPPVVELRVGTAGEEECRSPVGSANSLRLHPLAAPGLHRKTRFERQRVLTLGSDLDLVPKSTDRMLDGRVELVGRDVVFPLDDVAHSVLSRFPFLERLEVLPRS